jgi:integrase-like protein
MLLAPIPWAGCVWALPFLTVLAPSEQWSIQRRRRHKKLTDWARQALLQTARWLPGRRVIAVGDSSFSAIGQRQGALVSQQKLRDEFLKLEIFYSLLEAQVVDACRHHYNRIWLHSALGYRPPAPITLETVAQQLPTSAIVQYPLNVLHPKSRSGQT